MKQYIYAIVGSRKYKNRARFDTELSRLLPFISEIISGGAEGPDTWSKDFAIANNIPFQEFPADWDNYGKSAGAVRNSVMANNAQRVVAFWDSKSKGTAGYVQEVPC